MEQYIERDNEDIEHGVTIQQVVEITCQTDPIGCTSVLLDGMVEIIQAQDLEVPIPDAPPAGKVRQQNDIVDDQVNLGPPQAMRSKKKKVETSFKRNKPKLLDGLGYTYNVKRVRGSVTDWQCTVRSKALTCRATVKQQSVTFTPGQQPHLHFAEPGISSHKLETLSSSSKKDPKMTAKMIKAMKGKKVSVKSKGRKGAEKQYYSNYVFGQPRLIEKRTGHTYNFKKASGDITHWNCTLNSKSFKCKATLKQKNGEFTAGPESHCHVGRGNVKTTAWELYFQSSKLFCTNLEVHFFMSANDVIYIVLLNRCLRFLNPGQKLQKLVAEITVALSPPWGAEGYYHGTSSLHSYLIIADR